MNANYFIAAILVFFVSVQTISAQGLDGAKREAFVQKALQLRKEENYAAAIQQLDSILAKNPKDAGILLFRGDLKLQSQRFQDAVDTYKSLLPLNFETTTARINLSYALFMNHHPAKALQFAAEAWGKDTSNTSAVTNYINAMLWNSQTSEAAVFLKAQGNKLSTMHRLVLQARLYTTSGDYTRGLALYDSLARTYPDKNYVKEYAEVLLGKREIQRSEAAMKASEPLFTASEYVGYRQKLAATQLQNAGTEFVYFSDVAKNTRIENIGWYQQREGVRYRFRLSAGTSTITSAEGDKTISQFGHVTVNERFNLAWSGLTDVHLQVIKPQGSDSFMGVTGKQTIQYQPNDRRMVGLVYSSEILNYTANLLDKNIRSDNVGYVAHILFTGKTGVYTQGSFGALTDKNQRYQFFGSLYHLFRTDPTLKAGINLSALHYTDNTVTSYFSPDRFLNSEVFVDYSAGVPNMARFFLQVQAAAGCQQINDQPWEKAARFQSEISFRTYHFETGLKYQTSNVASAVGAGYAFNWLTLRLMWKW